MGKINGFDIAGALFDYDGTNTSITPLGTITLIKSFFISAGTIKGGDIFTIQSLITRSVGTSETINHYIYWNDTPNLNTPVLLATTGGGINDEYIPLYRTVCVVDSTTTLVYNTGAGNFEEDLGDVAGNRLTNAISTITSVNWGIDGYLIVAGNTNSTQITNRYFTILR